MLYVALPRPGVGFYPLSRLAADKSRAQERGRPCRRTNLHSIYLSLCEMLLSSRNALLLGSFAKVRNDECSSTYTTREQPSPPTLDWMFVLRK